EGLHIPLFEGLGQAESDVFFDLATQIDYPEGVEIIREGDPGRGLFFFASGNVSVDKMTIEGKAETLAIMEPGECFGEMALVDHKRRSATVRAMGNAEVFAFEKMVLDRFFEERPEIHLKIL
ncbi:MAG: cyclic nucleotide-binding domain-containing protein, partial [Candidatus Latescibacterota bacterium]|nr:cyclic nucleotide-binding domain-containing protein [Candidatus Latescibacterota bacterium]